MRPSPILICAALLTVGCSGARPSRPATLGPGTAPDTGVTFSIPSPVGPFAVIARHDYENRAEGVQLRYATRDSLIADVFIYPGPDLAADCPLSCARDVLAREIAEFRAGMPEMVRRGYVDSIDVVGDEPLVPSPAAPWQLGRRLQLAVRRGGRALRSEMYLLYSPAIRVKVRATYADTADAPAIRALAEEFPARLAGGLPGPPAVSPAAAALERAMAFEISSLSARYPLVTRLTGWYRVEPQRIVVQVEGGAVRSQLPDSLGDLGTLTGVWIAPGLGMQGEVTWRVDTLAPSALVALRLDAAREAAVRPMRFELPRPPGAELGERWLFFQVGATHPGLFGRAAGSKFANYACAEHNLLGPTAASRRRAERMRDDYVNAC